MQVTFFARGIPKGQPRPRAFARNGHAAVYDPGTAEGWKAQVAIAARPHRPPVPLDGPLQVTVEFLFPRPKSHFLKYGLRDGAPAFHTAKPDADNAAKAVLDALTIIGFWADDAQVASLIVTKRYCGQTAGTEPGAVITIRPL